MKKILIIGNSLSAWSVASAFINKKVNISIIGKKINTSGAQQLSPNGFRALKKLIQNDDIKNIVKRDDSDDMLCILIDFLHIRLRNVGKY